MSLASTIGLLSSIRRFYRYQVREGILRDDPSVRIDAPRIGRPLPDSLSEQEVEALLAAPDTETALGLRDRAMLELLYACGLRVSELVGLTREQLNLTQGVVRLLGKGRKERLVPLGEEALEWMARYFEVVTQTLHAHEATIDKYIGDAVMAFWNAPLDTEDHDAKACRAALAVVEAARAETAGWSAAGAPVRTRIGLHCGEAIVGNVGSSDRMNYTALGAAVNLSLIHI